MRVKILDRRTDPMQITIEIQLQEKGRVVGRSARVGALSLGEPKGFEVQVRDEGIEETDGVFGGDVILQPFGKQERL